MGRNQSIQCDREPKAWHTEDLRSSLNANGRARLIVSLHFCLRLYQKMIKISEPETITAPFCYETIRGVRIGERLCLLAKLKAESCEGILKMLLTGIKRLNLGMVHAGFYRVFHHFSFGESGSLWSPRACWQCLKSILYSANQIHLNPWRLEFVAHGYKDRHWQILSGALSLNLLTLFSKSTSIPNFSVKSILKNKASVICHLEQDLHHKHSSCMRLIWEPRTHSQSFQ